MTSEDDKIQPIENTSDVTDPKPVGEEQSTAHSDADDSAVPEAAHPAHSEMDDEQFAHVGAPVGDIDDTGSADGDPVHESYPDDSEAYGDDEAEAENSADDDESAENDAYVSIPVPDATGPHGDEKIRKPAPRKPFPTKPLLCGGLVACAAVAITLFVMPLLATGPVDPRVPDPDTPVEQLKVDEILETPAQDIAANRLNAILRHLWSARGDFTKPNLDGVLAWLENGTKVDPTLISWRNQFDKFANPDPVTSPTVPVSTATIKQIVSSDTASIESSRLKQILSRLLTDDEATSEEWSPAVRAWRQRALQSHPKLSDWYATAVQKHETAVQKRVASPDVPVDDLSLEDVLDSVPSEIATSRLRELVDKVTKKFDFVGIDQATKMKTWLRKVHDSDTADEAIKGDINFTLGIESARSSHSRIRLGSLSDGEQTKFSAPSAISPQVAGIHEGQPVVVAVPARFTFLVMATVGWFQDAAEVTPEDSPVKDVASLTPERRKQWDRDKAGWEEYIELFCNSNATAVEITSNAYQLSELCSKYDDFELALRICNFAESRFEQALLRFDEKKESKLIERAKDELKNLLRSRKLIELEIRIKQLITQVQKTATAAGEAAEVAREKAEAADGKAVEAVKKANDVKEEVAQRAMSPAGLKALLVSIDVPNDAIAADATLMETYNRLERLSGDGMDPIPVENLSTVAADIETVRRRVREHRIAKSLNELTDSSVPTHTVDYVRSILREHGLDNPQTDEDYGSFTDDLGPNATPTLKTDYSAEQTKFRTAVDELRKTVKRLETAGQKAIPDGEWAVTEKHVQTIRQLVISLKLAQAISKVDPGGEAVAESAEGVKAILAAREGFAQKPVLGPSADDDLKASFENDWTTLQETLKQLGVTTPSLPEVTPEQQRKATIERLGMLERVRQLDAKIRQAVATSKISVTISTGALTREGAEAVRSGLGVPEGELSTFLVISVDREQSLRDRQTSDRGTLTTTRDAITDDLDGLAKDDLVPADALPKVLGNIETMRRLVTVMRLRSDLAELKPTPVTIETRGTLEAAVRGLKGLFETTQATTKWEILQTVNATLAGLQTEDLKSYEESRKKLTDVLTSLPASESSRVPDESLGTVRESIENLRRLAVQLSYRKLVAESSTGAGPGAPAMTRAVVMAMLKGIVSEELARELDDLKDPPGSREDRLLQKLKVARAAVIAGASGLDKDNSEAAVSDVLQKLEVVRSLAAELMLIRNLPELNRPGHHITNEQMKLVLAELDLPEDLDDLKTLGEFVTPALSAHQAKHRKELGEALDRFTSALAKVPASGDLQDDQFATVLRWLEAVRYHAGQLRQGQQISNVARVEVINSEGLTRQSLDRMLESVAVDDAELKQLETLGPNATPQHQQSQTTKATSLRGYLTSLKAVRANLPEPTSKVDSDQAASLMQSLASVRQLTTELRLAKMISTLQATNSEYVTRTDVESIVKKLRDVITVKTQSVEAFLLTLGLPGKLSALKPAAKKPNFIAPDDYAHHKLVWETLDKDVTWLQSEIRKQKDAESDAFAVSQTAELESRMQAILYRVLQLDTAGLISRLQLQSMAPQLVEVPSCSKSRYGNFVYVPQWVASREHVDTELARLRCEFLEGLKAASSESGTEFDAMLRRVEDLASAREGLNSGLKKLSLRLTDEESRSSQFLERATQLEARLEVLAANLEKGQTQIASRVSEVEQALHREIGEALAKPREIPETQVTSVTGDVVKRVLNVMSSYGYAPVKLPAAPSRGPETESASPVLTPVTTDQIDPIRAREAFSNGYNEFYSRRPNRVSVAMRNFSTAASYDPANPLYRYFLGLSLRRDGHHTEAVQQVEIGVKSERASSNSSRFSTQLERVQGADRQWLERLRFGN